MAIRKADDHNEAILALLAAQDRRIRQAFAEMLALIDDDLVLAELEALIASGRIDDALARALRHVTVLADAVTVEAMTAAGQTGAALLSEDIDFSVRFDRVNTRAVRTMQEARLDFIRGFTEQQRAATREALVNAAQDGINPRETARRFRSSIGLTARQQGAVDNFRRLLRDGRSEALTRQLRDRRFDGTVLRAIRTGEPLSDAQIDRMVERYRERMLKFRSETIARTESLTAVHEGMAEAWNQAIDQGVVDAFTVEQTWITARDERVRSSHAAMHGQKRPMGEAFVSGNGNRLRYPGDRAAPASETISCRCVVTRRVVAARRLAA